MSVRDSILAEVNPNDEPFAVDCPGRALFDHVTSRWGVLVLLLLSDGAHRFHALRDRIGVSEKVLSQTLRTLTRDGLVRRSVEATIPPRVSYELTALGREVSAPLGDIARWVVRRIPEVSAARALYDAEAAALK
ncbi:Redox-sensing transcriptional regulator QorR [Minicystis rosea]|nr:Redox-sensing transcriptional regulator QorR [Minicystis rosea]